MALTSALFTGLSGLDVNQTRLNVVGNNIANANTVAFKGSRALFKPQFYVTDEAGTPSDGSFGGTNPSQRGLGASVSSIERDFSPGAIQSTGVATDMAVDGAGFFVIKGPDGQAYTRDGSFTLNDKNQLVTTDGKFVQGYGVDSNFVVTPGALQNLTIPLGKETIAKATGNVTLQGTLSAAGTPAAGSTVAFTQSLFTAGGGTPTSGTLLTDLQQADVTGTVFSSMGFTAGQTLTLNPSQGAAARDLPAKTFSITPTSTLSDLAGFMQGGLEIDPTAPAPTGGEAPGVTVAPATGDTAGVRLQIVGNTGIDNTLNFSTASLTSSTGGAPFAFDASKTTLAGVANNPSGESIRTSVKAYDSLGTQVTLDLTAVMESKSATGTTWRYFASSPDNLTGPAALQNGTLTFGTDGKLLGVSNDTVTIDRSGSGAAPDLGIKMDFSGVQALSDTGSALVSTGQDGFAVGTLSSFSVGADGSISGAFSNGLNRTIGQVTIATFDNPQGLIDGGGNQFKAGADSGEAIISLPEKLGGGSIRSGALEQSNVDLSKEFVNMIISSTGFSAASKVISTSDQLITELLNTSR